MTYSVHFAILPPELSAVLAKNLLHPGFRNSRGNCSFGRSFPKVHAQCQETFKNAFHACCFLQVVVVSPSLSHLVKTTSVVCRGWHASARSD